MKAYLIRVSVRREVVGRLDRLTLQRRWLARRARVRAKDGPLPRGVG